MGNQICQNYCKETQNQITNQPNDIIVYLEPDKPNNQVLSQSIEKKKILQDQDIRIPDIIKTSVEVFIKLKYNNQQFLEHQWIELENGNFYRGQLSNNIPYSFGFFVLNHSQAFYVGYFNQTMQPNGDGYVIYKNGNLYQGEFVNGKASGKGILKNQNYSINGIWQNGSFKSGKISALIYEYQGEFLNSKPHGKGFYRKGHDYYYEGEFKQGKFDGNGIERDQSYIYNGKWKQGKKEGYGVIEYLDGAIYKGQWKQNKKHGKGIFTSKIGKKWQGVWTQGKVSNGDWY